MVFNNLKKFLDQKNVIADVENIIFDLIDESDASYI
jgi:hypothetical protein